MNIIGGIIVILLSIYIGYQMSIKYTDRKEYFRQFSAFNNALLNEVAFSKNTIIKLVDKLQSKKQFNNAIKNYFNGQEIQFYRYLTAEENQMFSQYVDSIGQTDWSTQLNYLGQVNKLLEEKEKTAMEEEKKYRSLYIKLGFLLGLIMFIILL